MIRVTFGLYFAFVVTSLLMVALIAVREFGYSINREVFVATAVTWGILGILTVVIGFCHVCYLFSKQL